MVEDYEPGRSDDEMMPLARRLLHARLQSPHPGEPAVVVVALAAVELRNHRVRQDEEALVPQRRHHVLGNVSGVEQLARGRDDLRADTFGTFRLQAAAHEW